MSESVLGQGEEFARLLAMAGALRLHHGLLIEGAPGTGKTTAATALALALLDDGSASVAIAKQVAARQHPDLHWLTPAKDKVDIKVEDVRELQATLAAHAYAERARVAIIDPADRLNEQGQNALLKTLEEPGAAAFLLLTTTRPEGLLPTVRSRISRYRMRALAPDVLASALATTRPQADAATRAWAQERADGALGFAQDLVDDAIARTLDTRLVEFLGGGGGAHDLVAACLDGVSGREPAQARVSMVLRLLRAQLRRRLGSEDGAAEGEVLPLAFAGGPAYGALALDRWIESCEQVFETEVDVRQHIAVEQALLELFLELDVRASR